MTELNSDARKCPQCGTAVPADAAHGLCPRCVFAKAMAATGGAPIEPPDIEAVRAAFPQFEVVSLIGAGGMGAVFKVRQPQLDRFVALKILAPQRTDDARFAERFQREAQALARLNHPGIVTIHDFGQAGGFYFLLMEFVDGVNLRQAMQAGRFTPEQALAIVPPVCQALQYAHEHRIVHRDIKPENLLLDKVGRVMIADFGIAKLLSVEGSDVGLAESQPAGTPQYMAPEQKEHRATDHRADIYSLGVVLYELLTGELPGAKLEPPSSRIRGMQIDVRLDEIVLRALEQTPELRYQTAAALRTQVETVVSTPAGSGREEAPSNAKSETREPQAMSPAGSTGKRSPWLFVLGTLALVAMFLPVVLLLLPVVPPLTSANPNGVSVSAGKFNILAVLCLVIVGGVLLSILLLRGSTAVKVLAVRSGMALLVFFLGVGLVFIWLKTRQVEASRAGPVLSQASIPTHIEFKVQRVENPPGTRNIVMHFERDRKSGLGFEVTQNVMPSQAGQIPPLGFRDGRQKYWVGVNGSQTLSWVLPKEFTEAEARAAAKQIERKWKGSHTFVEGARLEFGPAVHREGWQYILCANVLREPGLADVEPPKPATFEVRLVVDTASPDSEELSLIQGTNGEKTPEERLHVQKRRLLDRSALKAAAVQKNAMSGAPEIQVTFTEHGARRFAEATRDHVGQRLAIVIAGKVYAAPKVMTEMTGGKAVVAGSFSEQEATDLVARLSE